MMGNLSLRLYHESLLIFFLFETVFTEKVINCFTKTFDTMLICLTFNHSAEVINQKNYV